MCHPTGEISHLGNGSSGWDSNLSVTGTCRVATSTAVRRLRDCVRDACKQQRASGGAAIEG